LGVTALLPTLGFVQAGLDVGAIGNWNFVRHLFRLDEQLFGFCAFNEHRYFYPAFVRAGHQLFPRLHKAFNVSGN
jgi:hypothetical protein